MTPREAMRLRAAVVADMLLVAQAFELGRQELEEFVEASAAWDPLVLRRKLNAVITATLENVVNAEDASSSKMLAAARVVS